MTDELAADFALPPELANGHKPFTRFDLAALVKAGIPPPELICQDMFYAEGLHSVAGPPDCGKSTLICWVALQVIRGGSPFILLDEESGPDQYGEKLDALGATGGDLELLHYFPFPSRSWTPDDISELLALVARVQPKMVAWDSSAAFLTQAGLDEDRAPDVTRFWSTVLLPCARAHKAAVLVADHDTKGGVQSRYARGSGAKLALTDVQMKLVAMTPFSRTQAGTLELTVSKDRRGWLHRWHEIAVSPDGGTLNFRIEATRPVIDINAPPLQQAIMKVITAQPESRNYIHNLVAREMQARPARESMSRALNELAERDLVIRYDMGPGKEAYWARAPR